MRNLKRALSLALASVMLLGMMVVGTGASYADVDAQDNLEAIEVLQMVGVMSGDDNGNFNPDQLVTRTEMAVIMCNLLGLTPGGSHPFKDVPAWANGYVAACYNNGIIAGYDSTTYGANDSVTAVQAALMIMKALGYFGYMGEFGDNWILATVKQANEIDLYDGVNAYTDQEMSRNNIAQMVLNALQCTVMVVREEGGLSVDGNGISVNVKPTYDKTPAENNSGKDYESGASDTQVATMQLCEKLYGEKLKKDNTTVRDDFGRPSTKWTYGDSTVLAPDAYDLIYTAAVTGEKIYSDLGNINPDNVVIWENGVSVTAGSGSVKSSFDIAAGEKTDNDKVGANGTVVEVYYNNDNPASTTATVVIINTYVERVTDCKELVNGKYEISLQNEGKKFESDVAYDIDDVVLYTKKDSSLGTTDKIKSMALADQFSGSVTNVKASENFTVGNVTYSYSSNFDNNLITSADKLVGTTVDTEVVAYTDSYGYVIAFGDVNELAKYAVVLGKTAGTFGDEYKAKLLFSDGTVSTVDIKKASYDAITVDHIVSYTVNGDNVYTLADVSTGNVANTTSALDIENGKASATINANARVVNNKTVFFFNNTSDSEYTAYVGVKNVPDFDNAGATYTLSMLVDDGVAKAVYIKGAATLMSNNTDDVAFVYSKGDEKLFTDTTLGDYYEFNAYVDGQATVLKIATGANAYSLVSSAGGYMVKDIQTDKNGVITKLTVSGYSLDGDGDGQIYVSSLASAAKDGVIAGHAYADNVKVIKWNTSDKVFETKSINSLKAGDAIYANVVGYEITEIYYIGA